VIFLGLLPPLQGDDARSPGREISPAAIAGSRRQSHGPAAGHAGAYLGQSRSAEEIAVEFSGLRKTIAADDAGNWKVTLDPLAVSSGSRTMTITASSGVDVLVRAATSQGIGRPDRAHREGIPPLTPRRRSRL
jgi:hypothetical protein